tara:strand:- start:2461 stop:3156 length:696 start_codon:yes stop_codon:yes gene_type:complete
MALIKEIVYDIKNIMRGGAQSDDELISDRQIEFQINSLRSQYIRQDINKRRSISDNIKQLIHSLDVETVSGTTCGLDHNLKIVRSKKKIPNAVETAHMDLITAIGPTGILSPNFHFISYNRAPYVGLNKYTKRMTFAFLLDSFVYVLGPQSELLDHVKVEGVWQDPREISGYLDKNGLPSYDPDKDDYPISTSMLDLIKQNMLALNIKPLSELPTDVSNNAKSDIQPNVQK